MKIPDFNECGNPQFPKSETKDPFPRTIMQPIYFVLRLKVSKCESTEIRRFLPQNPQFSLKYADFTKIHGFPAS